jgi:L-threonylcarbamoyladenylate synthase
VRLIDGPLAGAMSPVFQTSANRSGQPPPSRYEDLAGEIVGAVDLAIDGGELTGTPSTVVDISAIEEGGGWVVLREGGFARDALERALG